MCAAFGPAGFERHDVESLVTGIRRILSALLTLTLLALCDCGEESVPMAPTDPGITQSMEFQPTDPPATVPTEQRTDWSGYSDYELMEMTLKSDANAYKSLSSYVFGREWLLYMMEYCEPFKELMFRETALQSLEEHALELLTQYKDEVAGMRAMNFAELVVMLLPEMQEELSEFLGSIVTVTALPIN